MVSQGSKDIIELNGELRPYEDGKRWIVCYTKPHHEKCLAEFAYKHGVWYYLPLQENISSYGRKQVLFTKPLFPGYVFICPNDDQKELLLKTGFIVSTLKVHDEWDLIDQLKQLRFAKSQGAELRKGKFIEKGVWVEITEGPFQGLIGLVEKQSDLETVTLQVDMLRQAVTVDVHSYQVKILPEEYEFEWT